MASRTRAIGVVLIVLPPILIMACLIAYAMSSTLFGAGLAESGSSSQLFTILNFAISLIGFLATIGVFIGFPLGIYFLVRKDPTALAPHQMDPRSGKGPDSIVPPELKGWNWGAAGLTWIWGSYYSVWISLLQWISPINLIWWIFLGIHGNEWAWRNQAWASVQEFQAAQDKWKVWGILFVTLRVLALLFVLSFMFLPMGTLLKT